MLEVAVDRRYEGIHGVSHGGYLAGLAAKELGPSVTVTLSKAVPPGSTVTLERRDSQVLMRLDAELAAMVGWPIERQGRKVIAGAAIFSESGKVLVEARQTMILFQNGVPLHLTAWARA